MQYVANSILLFDFISIYFISLFYYVHQVIYIICIFSLFLALNLYFMLRSFFLILYSLFCFTLFAQLKSDHLMHLKQLYPTLENNYRVTHQHISNVSKVHHVYLVQTINNLDVVNAVLSLHIDANGRLIKTNNAFYPGFNLLKHSTLPTLLEVQAVKKFAEHLGKNTSKIEVIEKNTVANFTTLNAVGFNKDTIKTRLAYFMHKKNIKLIWQLNIQVDEDWWDAKIDANTGEMLEKINWTSHCNMHDADHDHSHAMSCIAPQAFVPNSFNVLPLGSESPIHGTRSLITNPANVLASPYGWNDTNGVAGPEFTSSKGNNVEAKDDIANDNETTAGAFAQGGANLEFDFSFTPNVGGITNINASLTNLFYWNNIMHDVWYQYGFDEASGNFQSNNYGRGGVANDFVYADGLDGSGTNNANFGTPVDGIKPRMQMYKWLKSKATVVSPASIAGTISSARANFGAPFFNLTNQIVLATPTEGCTAFTNAIDVAGKIAMVDRGTCELALKCLNAQNAGAIAVIVCNNVTGAPIVMPPGVNGGNVTIPAIMISQADCNTIKLNISNPSVVITITGEEYDSSFDNLVIAHEYGHGISTRLTGGAANSSCLSGQEQMGEGWSDWFGLMLSIKPYHTGALGRGVGNYLTTQDTNGVGIRPYKYSTNMTTNPHTYSSLNSVVAPHGVGSVWCVMLWELTWALIDKYGLNQDFYNGNGGNNKAMALVIEGIKLQPCFPGFVDGRDAILLADQVLFGGENQCLIWTAFAKRGLGFSASQGSSGSKSDGVQAFDLPPTCTSVKLEVSTINKYASPGDTLLYTIKTKNIGTTTLTNIELLDTLSANLQFISSPTATAIGQIVSFPTFNLNGGDSLINNFKSIVIPAAKVNVDSIVENAEFTTSKFFAKNTNTLLPSWTKSTASVKSGTFSWFASNDASANEKYFTLKQPIKPAQFCYMQFWHKYNTEVNWDGGKVQVSTDNKLTWQDLGPKMTLNGYNGYLDNNAAYPAFSGNSTTFINTVVNLSSYIGQTIFIRFWMHNDPADNVEGWYIDDIIFHNTSGLINTEVFETNTQNKNTSIQTYPPVSLVPCTKIYSNADDGQGSLRRALQCGSNGDQISVVNEMLNDTIIATSTPLIIDKNLYIANIDSSTIHIMSLHGDPTFIITNNANVTLLNLDVFKNNLSTNPGLLKSSGILTLDGTQIKLTNNANNSAFKNDGGDVIIKRNTKLLKQ